MTEPHQNTDGRVVLRAGAPVMSERSYVIRRFQAGIRDRVPPGPNWGRPRSNETPIALLFEDTETGIITADVSKFEKWIGKSDA